MDSSVRGRRNTKALIVAGAAALVVVAVVGALYAFGTLDGLFTARGGDTPAKAVTLEQFDKIENGMSLGEVNTIFGGTGSLDENTSHEDDEGNSLTTYTWDGASSDSRAIVMFAADTVVAHTHFGLE